MKFEDSEFDEDTNTTYVFYSHLGRSFCGSTTLYEEDAEHENKFFAGNLAELKAIRKAKRYELQQKKEEIKIVENFVKKCGEYNNFERGSSTAGAVFRQLNRKKRELIPIQNEIERLDSMIAARIKAQDEYWAKKNNDN